MRLLLDECVTRYLKRDFIGHEVQTVDEAGVKGLKNGALLRAAEGQFDVLVTVDKNIPHQQNMGSFRIALLILIAKNNRYEVLKTLIPTALKALTTLQPGGVSRVESAD
jgi:hypothetical protein